MKTHTRVPRACLEDGLSTLDWDQQYLGTIYHSSSADDPNVQQLDLPDDSYSDDW